ncbi:MAG: ActS/PrrB/RegB family redox-sensitive histidine kinase [Rhodospirillales bacterium]|nr:ActS/PrrB/RegB family redox-sensitive histidine kinase [Rhodospirillales bacterium]
MVESGEAQKSIAETRPLIGRVRLRTLIAVRWVAIAGQAASLVTVDSVLGFELPLGPALAAVAVSAMLNLVLTFNWPAALRLGNRETTVLLAYDLLQLSVLLYLTGGLANPFSVLMLAPVTVSATILSRRSTLVLCSLAIVAASVLAVWHAELPWHAGGLHLPPLYVGGLWTAFVLAALFVALYAGSVAEEARQLSDALAATQMVLAREQRLSAVGALAAAAAHELGTPLGTIAIVAREIARDLPKDGPLAEDAALLLAQTARCRDILARLAARPEAEGAAEQGEASPFSRLPISGLVEAAAAPHHRPEIILDFVAASGGATRSSPEPLVARAPEIVHGLGNLIQNAVQFARARVQVRTIWDDESVEVSVADDGRGFAPPILDRLGEPYLSTRNAEGEHMGLGVFIATTLLERTGAAVVFANNPAGGARAKVTWPRARIEKFGSSLERPI